MATIIWISANIIAGAINLEYIRETDIFLPIMVGALIYDIILINAIKTRKQE